MDSIQRDDFELPTDSKPFFVQIDYSDLGSGIDSQTISPKDITISGAANLTITNATLGGSNTAIYTINAPKGGWQNSDVGKYNITLNAGEIKDIAGNNLEPLEMAKTFEIQPKKIIQHPDSIEHLIETNAILTATGSITDLPKLTAQKDTHGKLGTFKLDELGNWTYVTDSPHNEFLPR